MRPRFNPTLALITLLVALAPPARATTIHLTAQDPAGVGSIGDPVTRGVPIAQPATASSVRWALFDGSTEIPVQTVVLPGVRNSWLLLDFRSTVGSGATKTYTLISRNPTATASPALNITETPGKITVTTGPLKVEVNKLLFNLFETVWLDKNHNGGFSTSEKVVLPTIADNLPLVTADNARKLGRRLPLSVSWDDKGPLRATLRVDGFYGDSLVPTDTLLYYTTRMTFYAGQQYVTVQHLIRNSFHAYERYVKVKSAKLLIGTNGAIT